MQGARIRQLLMLCTFVLVGALATTPAAAQTGQVRGRVVDQKDQPVEGATVTIAATDGMGRKFTVKSNRRGEFVQIGLQPGQYRITAEKGGLSDMREQRIGLDSVEVNFTLRPGGAAGEVSPEDRKKAEERVKAITGAFDEGVRLSKEGKHDEAIAKFNEVIGQAPKCVECYTNIASVQVAKKDYEAAEKTYKAALEINPNSADIYNALAGLYNTQKKFDQAAEASAQAAKLGAASPGGASASAVFNQGVIMWNASKFPEAKKAFAEAVKLDPKMADAHYLLGMANLNEGNVAEAVKAFEEYQKLAPTGQYAEQVKNMLGQLKK